MDRRGFARLAHMARQARLMPRRVDTTGQIAQLILDRLERIEAAAQAGRRDAMDGVSEVLDAVRDAVDRGDSGFAEARMERAVLLAAVAEATRDVAFDALVAAIGPPRELRPGLSVQIPCWNHAAVVGEAIRSATACLDRVGGDGEVIVIDDFSDDGSDGIIDAAAAADPRVRVFRAKASVGLVRVRNAGYRAATYRHMLMLDADNVADPDGVAALLDAARKTGATLAYGPLLAVDETGRAVDVTNRDLPSAALLRRTPVDTFSVRDVARMRALGGHSTRAPHDPNEDYALLFRLLRLGEPIVHVPMLTGRYRLLPHRMSMSSGSIDPVRRALLRSYTTAGTPEVASVSRRVVVPGAESAVADPPTARLLVLSSGGVSNFGDDAILLNVVDRLRGFLGDGPEIMVATDGPRPPEVGWEYRWVGTLADVCGGVRPGDLEAGGFDEPPGVVGAGDGPDLVDWSRLDAVILAGGGSLTSHFPGLAVTRAALAAVCTARRVPLIATGQGLGPFVDSVTADLAAAALGGAAVVAVRDRGSSRLAMSLGVPGAVVAVDDAAGLRTAPSGVVSEVLGRSGLAPGESYLAASLREASYGADARTVGSWADEIDEVAAERGLTVVGVPFSRAPAVEELLALVALAHAPGRRARWLVVDPGRDVRLVAGVVSGAEAAAVTSFHAALFAATARVPVAILTASTYQRAKAEGLVGVLGLPDAAIVDGEGGGRIAVALAAGVASADVGSLVAHRDGVLFGALDAAGCVALRPAAAADPAGGAVGATAASPGA